MWGYRIAFFLRSISTLFPVTWCLRGTCVIVIVLCASRAVSSLIFYCTIGTSTQCCLRYGAVSQRVDLAIFISFIIACLFPRVHLDVSQKVPMRIVAEELGPYLGELFLAGQVVDGDPYVLQLF